MQQKESIDLMNIEYEDVLQLYRGWRRSESALKDKNKELAAVKDRIKLLQESHSKFRGQMQSLESVKDLTVTLQSQLASMQQENKQLSEENRELAQLNLQAEEMLKEKERHEENEARTLRSVQLEFAAFKGRYEETMRIQRELEQLASDEQALRIASEARCRAAEESVASMKEENRSLRQQMESSALRLNQCDQELQHASEQLSNLSRELSVMHEARNELSTKDAEIGILKGDISRLLRLLELSPATKDYIAHWQDSGGMDFVGIDRDLSAVSRMTNSQQQLFEETGLLADMTLDSKRRTNSSSYPGKGGHDASILTSFDLSPAEFAHLKRVHGGDPFPLTASLREEAEYWVPSEAAKLGLQFLSARIPHASPKVIMDFLRSMNKIWLKRELRKVKRVKQVLGSTIDDLKRQLDHSRPYKGVIADRQIKRLSKQVKTERRKKLQGRPKDSLEAVSSSGDIGREVFDFADRFPEPTGEKRLCRLVARSSSAPSNVNAVSTQKLLEASLQSLEDMGRQMTVAGTQSIDMGDTFSESKLHHSSSTPSYPNESYLRGAMWLGRNFTIVTEELAEELDNFRSRFVTEVNNASEDLDSRRCCHRLTLLATSGITQAFSLVNKSRSKTREILQVRPKLS